MMVAILQHIHFMLQTHGYDHHIKLWSMNRASQQGCTSEIIAILPFIVILLARTVKTNWQPNTQTTALWIHSTAIYFKYMIKIYFIFKYNCIRYTDSQKIKSRAFKYNTLYIITYTMRQEGIYTWKEKAYPENECYLWYTMALSARKSVPFA